jgi:hypothetical protein
MSFFLMRLLSTLGFAAFTAFVSAPALRRSFPVAWQRFGRRVYRIGLGGLLGGAFAWAAGRFASVDALYVAGSFLVSAGLVTSLLLLMSMPVWGTPTLVRALARRLARRRDERPDPSRRAFLSKAAGVVPVAAVAAGPIGSAASLLPPVVRRVEIEVHDLPVAFDGLSVLQLTDVHLGTFIDVDQVERAIGAARAERPDLVVLTGDIADDYEKLGPALEVVSSLAPRSAATASSATTRSIEDARPARPSTPAAPCASCATRASSSSGGESGSFSPAAMTPRPSARSTGPS